MSRAFVDRMKVRYRDADAQGHLYFANYLVIADELAADYMEELGFSITSASESAPMVFSANINCDYLAECVHGDTVRAVLQYEKLGRSSAVLAFELLNDKTEITLARGQITQVFVDRQTRRSCAIPASFREEIEKRHPELARR